MWSKPTEKQLGKIPALNSTEKTPLREKIIHMHFFIGGCDWYIAEYDPENQLFFGFAILNMDYDNAEWGYISYSELCSLKVSFMEVDRDRHFPVTKAGDVDKIKTAQNWN